MLEPRSGAPLLTVRDLTVRFATPAGDILAAQDVTFSIERGETVGLVGESGCGKSVTALAILGLIDPPGEIVSGQIIFEGEDLRALPRRALRARRGSRVAMVFQDPASALHPFLPIGRQLADAARAHQPLTKPDAERLAVEWLGRVGLDRPAERARGYAHELSGGQRQRVVIAMALVHRPLLLIADEPTTALDVTTQARLIALLSELRAELGMAMLFVSHDLPLVASIASRVVVLYASRIVETGTTHDVFHAPLHPYTRALVESVPRVHGDAGRPLAVIPGRVPGPFARPSGCAFHPRCPLAEDRCRSGVPALVESRSGHGVACHVSMPSGAES